MTPPSRAQAAPTFVAAARDSAALLESRARHPSSARHYPPRGDFRCPACGWAPLTPANAPDTVRRLSALASELLLEGSETATWTRVARLRDELHVVANRVERFSVDEHPIIDLVRIATPASASVALARDQLLFQLDLTVGRLAALLERLGEDDWRRSGRSNGAAVTLGQFVEEVLHGGVHDLLDAASDAPPRAAERVSSFTPKPARQGTPQPPASSKQGEAQDVVAS